jgi:hypothetical protein
MREVEKTILYELTPEERDNCTLEDEMIRMDQQGWKVVTFPRKQRMHFDANYNSYYAKVHYERTVKVAYK